MTLPLQTANHDELSGRNGNNISQGEPSIIYKGVGDPYLRGAHTSNSQGQPSNILLTKPLSDGQAELSIIFTKSIGDPYVSRQSSNQHEPSAISAAAA